MTATPILKQFAGARPMPISREQYAQMGEFGMFNGRRVQLINGAIIEMNAMGPKHWNAMRTLNGVLNAMLFPAYDVLSQLQVNVSEYSSPEPDFTISRRGAAGPIVSAPLFIEVSDSTLKFDLEDQALLYATAKIPECWVIDLKSEVTVVHMAPKRGEYSKVRRVQWTTTLHSASVPELKLKLSEVL